MTLDQPIWLLVLLPLGLAWWRWPAPTRALQGMRAALIVLVVLALCGPRVTQPDRTGTVVVVADRSRSMPVNVEARQREAIELLQKNMQGRDKLAVVSFGQRVVVERAPAKGPFGGFSQAVGRDGSNLEAAIDRALTLIPEGDPGRVLVLSDGRWTGRDPAALGGRASSQQIAVDYRHLARPRVDDVAIARLSSPVRVNEGESFMLHAWVRAPTQQRVKVTLRRGDTIIAEGQRTVSAGRTRLTFRDTAEQAGTNQYRLQVQRGSGGSHSDPVPENNTAHRLVGVRGDRPVLVVSQTSGAGLAELLKASGVDVRSAAPNSVDWSLAGLSNYRAVLLENVPASAIGRAGMEQVAGWVEKTGGGLMMTGGQRSFGPGGYFKSPIDPLLPVSMELRQEHRKFALAIAVVLDRSGSMSAPVGGGQVKMDLANLGAAQVYDLLSPMDSFGAIAVDSAAHQVAPLRRVGENPNVKNNLKRIQSMGGGIHVYDGLEAATQMLTGARPDKRHIVLFADARDSQQPGKYKALLEKCQKANISVSVIGLGTKGDRHAPLLKDIADRGNGNVYFTKSAKRLPQLFAQDTFTVARSSFIKQPTPIQARPALTSLTGQAFSDPPSVAGYNLCYLRPEARLAMQTRDKYNAPLVAAWRAGIGRVAAYTGEANGKYTGPIGQWPKLGPMLASLTRWTAAQKDELDGEMMLTQQLNRGRYTVKLHLSSQAAERLTKRPRVTTLRGKTNEPPTTDQRRMQWRSPTMLAATFDLTGEETALSTVHVPDKGEVSLAPVRLPYSPEFQPVRDDRGKNTLQRLADVTAGKARSQLAGIWQALPEVPQSVRLSPWLLIGAIVLLLLEVLQRRTAMVAAAIAALSHRRRWRSAESHRQADEQPTPAPSGRRSRFRWLSWRNRTGRADGIQEGDANDDSIAPGGAATAKARSAKTRRKSEQPQSGSETEPQPTLGSALDQARQRAGRRTRHDKNDR